MAAALWALDRRAVLSVLREADLAWALVAAGCCVVVLLLMAGRWCFTARRLGVPLMFRDAFAEYIVGSLLNQTLPGGVAGDVGRVVRLRGGATAGWSTRSVLRSVVLERVSGNVALLLVLGASAVAWNDAAQWTSLGLLGLGGLGLLGALIAVSRHPRWRLAVALRSWGDDVRATLRGRGVFVHLALSGASIAGLMAFFGASARAVALPLTPIELLELVPWILLSTTVQVTLGGWGIREMSAAALAQALALDPERAAAASIVFGGLSLVVCLPGLALLARERTVKKDVGSEGEVSAGESEGVLEIDDARQRKRGAPRSHDERSDDDVETVERTRL